MTSNDRKKNIEEIETFLNGTGKKQTLEEIEQTLLDFALKHGLSVRIIREYLSLLILSKRVDKKLFKGSKVFRFRTV